MISPVLMNMRSGAGGLAQNIPKRIAPTNMIAAHTASTFNFTAKSTLQASLNVDVAKAYQTSSRARKR